VGEGLLYCFSLKIPLRFAFGNEEFTILGFFV
jgi:hypothetical protein